MAKGLSAAIPTVVALAVAAGAWACGLVGGGRATPRATATPIQHVVVIFDENISFDHYFGLYPTAANPPGEPQFVAVPNTPAINGLRGDLLTNNPNLAAENGPGATNPFRLDRTQAATSDQNHSYTPEQRAYHDGRADLFPRNTGRAGTGGTGAFSTTGLVMGYFDGNTVTALWSYAQHYAMSDNAYSDQYGPSSPGAINLVSGQTNGIVPVVGARATYALPDGQGGRTMISDPDPASDSCSSETTQAAMTGKNIGDLLNRAGVSWGWFQGGFDLSGINTNGSTSCTRSTHSEITNITVRDYVPHHEPFQFYASTANPRHRRPASATTVGTPGDTVANHQYDIQDFFDAVRAGNLPAVSFLKPPAYENGHAGNSDPLDEQRFVVQVINFLQQQPAWANTAVIIAYDDSDGWYDHQMAPVSNASFDTTADQLSGPGRCGDRGRTQQLRGVASTKPVNGRCGPGARQPFLLISPWARANYVDHTLIIQSSIIHFIEDNWLGGKRIGGGSFDETSGTINSMFDFKSARRSDALYLDPEPRHDARRAAAPAGRRTLLIVRRALRLAIAALAAVVAVVATACSAGERDVANRHPVTLRRPPTAPLSEVAALGREIFYDSALSASGRVSCASCHRPERAYASDRTVPPLGRAVPSLMYVYRTPAFSIGPAVSDADEIPRPPVTSPPRAARVVKSAAAAPDPNALVASGGLFWDGRVNTLQTQAIGPLFNAEEMGNRDVRSAAERIRRAAYVQRLAALFGAGVLSSPGRLVDEATFAVARYQIEDSSFHPYDSRYDAYLEGRARLSASEWRGLQAFDDPARGNCAACHLDRPSADGVPPAFTDYEYEALGVPRAAVSNHASAADTGRHDLGACGPLRTDLSGEPRYCGLFRTPSLRNAATRSVFFHNGVFRTLDEVLAFYDFRDTRPERIYPKDASGAVRKFDDMPAR